MNKLLLGSEGRVPLTKSLSQRNELIFNIIIYTLVGTLIISGASLLWNSRLSWQHGILFGKQKFKQPLDLVDITRQTLSSDADEPMPRDKNCTFYDCLNIYRCGQNGDEHLKIYVYPVQNYVVDDDDNKLAYVLTSEFYQILETIVNSPYYTSNPNEACLYMPSIDLLNQQLINTKLVSKALANLEYWDRGENHLLFNMLPGDYPLFNTVIDVNTDRGIILGGGFDTWSYRLGFDIALPVWSPRVTAIDNEKFAEQVQREYILIVAQLNLLPEHYRLLIDMAQDNKHEMLMLHSCDVGTETTTTIIPTIETGDIRCNAVKTSSKACKYPHVLSKGTFCLLARSLRLGQPDLLEMLASTCIPVIAIDNYVLPFEDVLDWSLASIRIREAELHLILQHLNAVSNVKILELQQQIRWLYKRYFYSLQAITHTALQILESRIFPTRAKSVHKWNAIDSHYKATFNPLFLPLIAPKNQGFTAVILTFDRVESLFTLIQKLAVVPSLQCILVIWNNQKKLPPHLSLFPSTAKPIKVIQTRANKLSNRFFPYTEIETEAVLTIDDDIIMLTADELDFGFEVWREFPDRIVGFPSRLHVWDNTTNRWYYESEWTNQISMVLTGAAFHHKYWNHMYTYAMPTEIKDWVDEHMNCEDIAMNFLVANLTNKPPIKVTPRKKFKCPECTNTEMLSADLNHMRERSACIDRFARIYGHMPLRSVEFRADPVLFKDNFPEKLKRFNDIGSL